jgi:uncharacterized protein
MSANRSASRAAAGTQLDPRAPLVLDTRELGRRPGTMKRVSKTVDAPAGWELELVRVPPATPIALDLRLESVMDGVLVSGTATTTVTAECGRCLEPVSDSVTVEVQELFAYEPTGDDDEQPLLTGDFLDLEPLVRDAIVLGLPLNPVCDEDCLGLCSTCGVRLEDVEPDHAHDDLDPRWAALSQLTDPSSTTAVSDKRES